MAFASLNALSSNSDCILLSNLQMRHNDGLAVVRNRIADTEPYGTNALIEAIAGAFLSARLL